ncbi:MAG: hypothetical protein RLZZ210_741 [Pseudomonadota bacterium]|jgi:hypothetical protein
MPAAILPSIPQRPNLKRKANDEKLDGQPKEKRYDELKFTQTPSINDVVSKCNFSLLDGVNTKSKSILQNSGFNASPLTKVS